MESSRSRSTSYGMKKIYLDYAATTPVDLTVEKEMRQYLSKNFGNPSSLHSFGQAAINALDATREKVANLIGADFRQVLFTGSATEANNLVLRGVVKKSKKTITNPRIIISAVEHESVLETCKNLEKEGVDVIYLPVDRNGLVNLDKLKEFLNNQTVLVSIMYANNEIGTIQPIFEISKIIKNFRKSNFPIFHTDAVQAAQYLNCNVKELGVDAMTISGHKIYGPKGVGALYLRDLNFCEAIITGGGQEFRLRSGTENVAGIIGLAKALELAVKNKNKENKRVLELRNYFWKKFQKIYPTAELNGSPEKRLPNNLNVFLPGHSAQDFLISLDMAGVAASAGSACFSRTCQPSYVIKALGYSVDRATRSVRFSFGKQTNKLEIEEALNRIESLIKKA